MLEIIAALIGLEANYAPEIHGALPEPSPVVEFIHREPEIKGLIGIIKRHHSKVYDYETTEGTHIVRTDRIKGVPDLRTYEARHPIWHKVQAGFDHWSPVLQGGSAGIGTGLSGYALYRLFKP